MFFVIDSYLNVAYHFLTNEEQSKMLSYYSYNDIQSLSEEEIMTYSDFLEDYEESDLDPDDKIAFFSEELNIILDSAEAQYGFTYSEDCSIYSVPGLPPKFYDVFIKDAHILPDQFFKDINNITTLLLCPVFYAKQNLFAYTDTLMLFDLPLYGFTLDNLIKYLKITKIPPTEINVADGIYYINTKDILASEYALISNVQLPSVIDTKIDDVKKFIKCMC